MRSGLTFSKYSPLILITGARLQAPMQVLTSMLNRPSRVVSPSLMPRFFSSSVKTFKEPLMWQAVPRQARMWYLPLGLKRN